jgi:hypothetical protein
MGTTALLLLFKKYWKQLIVIAAIVIAAITGYMSIKNIGYREASAECTERMAEFNNSLKEVITVIEKNSSTLVKQSEESNLILKKDISNILSTIKNKPLYIIKDGKCSPSVDFVEGYNQIIDRVNKK